VFELLSGQASVAQSFVTAHVPRDSVLAMTVKVVVLYTKPADPAGFDDHYLSVHVPLVAKIPGLQRAETGKLTAALDGGEQTYYRIAELYFADQAAMEAAFASPEGTQTAQDYGQIAPPGSRLLVEVLDD
jgi:uncharacterized protein (TIGR02118 family)